MYKTILTLALIAFASQAAAKETTYICKVDDKYAGIIQPDMAIGYNDASGSVVVHDAVTNHFAGGAVDGKLSEKTDKKQVFTWTVTHKNRKGQQTVMRYRASIFIKTGKAIVTAKPHGYSNNFISRGRCKIDNSYKFPSS